jgi:hypothetical protein
MRTVFAYKNKQERSQLTVTHLSSIMKMISAQYLKPVIRTLAANKKCKVSGKNSVFIFKKAYWSFCNNKVLS